MPHAILLEDALNASESAVVVIGPSLEIIATNTRWKSCIHEYDELIKQPSESILKVLQLFFGNRFHEIIEAITCISTGQKLNHCIVFGANDDAIKLTNELKLLHTRIKGHVILSFVPIEHEELDHALVHQLMSTIEDAVIVTDQMCKVIRWNSHAEKHFGITRSVALGQSITAVMTNINEQKLKESLKQTLTWSGHCFLHSHESQSHCLHAWLLGTTKKRWILFIHHQDEAHPRTIVDENHDHEMTHRGQRLEALGALAGGVAHDFNNMLSAIQSYASFLYEDSPEGSSQRADAQEILAAAQRGAALTQQLLAFGRKQVFDPQLINLDDVVDSIERLLGRLLGEHISILIERTESPKPILIDVPQLEQVIVNLSVNARDAMSEGGMLIIRTQIINVTPKDALRNHGTTPGQYAELSVIDTGTGMNEEVKARLFEPFFTTKGPHKGTGLGLSTAYGMISQSGGHILVESKIGFGSTFRVRIPLQHGKTSIIRPARPTPLANINRPALLLIVEDDPKVREVVRRVLSSRNYIVQACADANEALTFLSEFGGPVDLLLTDLALPGMSGAILAERVRHLRKDIAILYMTGYADAAAEHLGVTMRGRDVLHKPFSPAALVDRVKIALEKVDVEDHNENKN